MNLVKAKSVINRDDRTIIKNKFIYEILKNKALYMMMLPALFVMLIINYMPMAGLVLAFQEFRFDKGIFGSKWVGFANFEYLFTSSDAYRITKNTIGLNALFISTAIISAVVFAIILNELRGKLLPKIYQGTMFVPNFISWVVAGQLVYTLLNADQGLINKLLMIFGKEPVIWYNEPKYWPLILMMANIWKTVGVNTIIFMATITSIDPEFYDAAKIDGAGRWQQIKSIIIPHMIPIITIITLLSIGKIFYADFGLFYNLPRESGLLMKTTDVIDTYVYRSMRILGDTGMAAAAGFYQSIVGFVLVLVSNFVVKKINSENALF